MRREKLQQLASEIIQCIEIGEYLDGREMLSSTIERMHEMISERREVLDLRLSSVIGDTQITDPSYLVKNVR